MLTLTVDVPSGASGSLTNTAIVSGGGEVNTSNDTATDTVSVLVPPDLTVAITDSGHFKQGDTADTYTITVTNSGAGATIATVSLVDTLPAGLTATAFSGTGWTMNLSTLTATRSDPLAAHSSYAVLTLTVSVAENAPASVTNTVAVSGGGEINTSNDTASDTTNIGVVLPVITGTTPSLTGGTLTAGVSTLTINFDEAMTGAGIASNYELRDPGPDGLFNTSDDVTCAAERVLQRHHGDADFRRPDGECLPLDRVRHDHQRRRRRPWAAIGSPISSCSATAPYWAAPRRSAWGRRPTAWRWATSTATAIRTSW